MTLPILRSTLATVLATVSLVAQTKPAFEVATIKRNTSLEVNPNLEFTQGGGFLATSVPLFTIVASAYSTSSYALRPWQVIGTPRWAETERYDIAAKPPDNAARLDKTLPVARQRLQSLLEDRFKLRVHRDKRQMQVYELVRKDPAALGPQMAKSSLDCEREPTACGFRGGLGHIKSDAITPEVLTVLIANSTGRIVMDRTGLTGWFRVDLEWSPDQTASDKPSLFAAVQEQLGLKLESTRAPVDVLVIDHIERPSEN